MTANQFRYNAADVKAAARGRWREILSALAGIPQDLLDGRHHPCPWCGGTDRFSLVDADAGACLCRKCFDAKNGDGIAAVMKGAGCTFPEALERIGTSLGLAPMNGHAGNGKPVDPIAAVCQAKRMPQASALAYGAKVDGSGVVFPMFGPDGSQCSEFTIRPTGSDRQRKGLCAKYKEAGVFLPTNSDGTPRLPQPGETWLVVEGVKDAATLHSLGYLALGINTSKLGQKFVKLLRGVDVVLVPDRDVAGIDGAESTARKVCGVAASVKIAALPAEVTEKDGKDVRDILAQADGEQLVREAIEQAAAWQKPKSDDPAHDNRVRIYDGPKEHEVADQAVAALAELDGLYQRGGNLVEIARDPDPPIRIIRPPGSPYIAAISEPGLLDRLSQAARFYQIKKAGDNEYEQDVSPPLRIAKIIASRRHWPGVPVIEGIIHAPAFLADGSILARPGYCPQTGLYLASNCEFPAVPQSPTKADAEHARDELLEVVCDFPFSTPAHKAAWLALVLTPAARFAFDGPTPLGAFDANVRGSGKSKLADTIGMIHLGTDMPRTPYPDSNEEFRKQITSVLLAGERLMLVDNVAGTLGGAALDALLTATAWNERILGASKLTGRLAAVTVWMASGNNLVFGADTARRTLTCRLESKEENPEEREGFRHPNLLPWVKANRARLAIAAVTILRAYYVAGRPKMGIPQWGSYEGWSDLVRNSVVWCGMPDPGETRQEVRNRSDDEAQLLRVLLNAFLETDPEGHGMTVVEAMKLADDGDAVLGPAFAEMAGRNGKANPRSVGQKLRHLRGRVCGGLYFESRDTNKGAAWMVKSAASQGSSDSSDSSDSSTNPPTRARAHAHEESLTPGATVTHTFNVTPGSDDEWGEV